MGYPDPLQIPYDDDGVPSIQWKSYYSDISPNLGDVQITKPFSCIEFYEAINYNPEFFNP